jgi:NADP-dependent 3-hydroxy acid dehydrogenase YdfG
VNVERRTIIVTGASRGIGLAISNKLLAEGFGVIGISRSPQESQHELFTPIALDLSKLEQLPQQLQELRRNHQEVDGMVFNAGYGRFGSLEEFSPQQISELIDTNLTSQIILAREFIPLLKGKKRGDMIFMGSEAALSGGKRGAVYCATKFGLRGLAQSLREECAGSGVRVGIINPGMVETEFFSELDFQPGEAESDHLQPDDVAEAVWLMLSARPGAVVDEINLSPQQRVIRPRQ